jgi:hypothetical protein
VVSDDLTSELAGRVFVVLPALAGIGLAGGYLLPLSPWFRDLASLVMLSAHLIAGVSGCNSGPRSKAPALSALVGLTGVCLLVKSPVPRLALLAWVFMSEFWVERYPVGMRRGRAGDLLVLAGACLVYAALLAAYNCSTGLWYLARGLRACLVVHASRAWQLPAAEGAAVYGGACLVVYVGTRAGRLVRRSRGVAAAYALATLALISTALSPGSPAPGPPKVRPAAGVVLYSAGLLDWDVPEAGRAGLLNSGMFGLFRKSLERQAEHLGGAVSLVDSVSAASLRDAGLVVFINPTRALAAAERSALSGFVRAGGGLLVLGDHTDIGGSWEPLTGVLEDTRIRFNFDSAISVRPRWRGCLEIRDHAVTAGVTRPGDMQVGIGASLDIWPPAFPIVIGRYAYGDAGDYANAGRGAYMGNGIYDAGEALGDLVLTAGEEVGRGRVLVFGDTSPFQNGARFLSRPLIAGAVGWVWGVDAAAFRPYEDIAAIDFGHNPEASRDLFTETSLGGLANCLYRAGLTPVPSERVPVDTAAITFIIAPTRALTDAESRRLLRYMRSGGRLVLAQGYAEPDPCAALLDTLGLAIVAVPLGGGEAGGPIRHKNAWATTSACSCDTVVHATAFGYPTVVTRPVGKGSFTLVSDGGLLLDASLEGETRCVPDNIAFLATLLGRLMGDNHHESPADCILAGRNPD